MSLQPFLLCAISHMLSWALACSNLISVLIFARAEAQILLFQRHQGAGSQQTSQECVESPLTYPSGLQSTMKSKTCMVLSIYHQQYNSGFLLNSCNLFWGFFFPHCVNQINLSCSLQQINTHIFPVACYGLQNWVCFRQWGGKLGKQVLNWQKEPVWFVVYGSRCNTSQVLCVSVLWHIFWWAVSQPGSFQGKVFAVPPGCPLEAVPLVKLQRCKLGSICPKGGWQSECLCVLIW